MELGWGKTLVARAIRNAIRANRFARIIRNWNPNFYSASGQFARITQVSDSRESPDSRESCESIRANRATKGKTYRGEGGRKLFSVGGVSWCCFPPPPPFREKHENINILLWWGSSWLQDNRPVIRTKKLMCSPPNPGGFSSTGWLSQGYPKNLLRLFFASKIIWFLRLFLKTLQNYPLKQA